MDVPSAKQVKRTVAGYDITMSLQGSDGLCHMGVKCVRHCKGHINEIGDGPCHAGECWPKDKE